MNTLIEGIVSRFTTDGTLSAVGGPWLDVAKDNATYPYCVMLDQGGQIRMSFRNADGTLRTLQPCNVTFRIYHTSDSQLRTYQAALHSRFDLCSMTLTDGIMRSAIRLNSFRGFAGRDKQGKSVYVATSVYRFTVQDNF